MKLDSFDIREFSQQEEYTNPSAEDVGGRSLLIKGENRSGKTLTFNALRYVLLGDTINVAPGRGSELEIGFTDGSRFYRGLPNMLYETDDGEYEAAKARTKLREKTGQKDLLDAFFLHSHIEELPIENLSAPDRLNLIRSVTDPDQQSQIRYHSEAFERLEWMEGQTRDESRKIGETIDELRKKISSFESQERKAEKITSMGESGQLGEIQRVLSEHQELDEELQGLFKRKDGIRKQLDQKRNRRDQFRTYEKEIDELISEAVNDFVCPTCETSVSSQKAQNRLDNNQCPFCGRRTSISDLREELRAKQEDSEGMADEIQNEIDELKEEREEVEREIERLKAEMPTLEELDGDARRRLNTHDQDVQAVVEAAEEELEDVRPKLDDRSTQLAHLENEMEVLQERIDWLVESKEFAVEQVEELREESHSNSVVEFSKEWTETFETVTPSISQEIGISEDGGIFLPGTPDREYEGDDLSDSERQLLNLTFAITLSKFTEDNSAPLETIVLDEPFNHLDETSTEEVLEYLLEDGGRQYVFTSSNRVVWDAVPGSQVLELERGTIQSELTDFY
jgi:DNA repair exonuclease SbcCD ATPase subunit